MTQTFRQWGMAMCLLLLTVAAHAVPVWQTQTPLAHYTGSRDVTVGGITGSGAWADSFKIAWEVTQNGDLFHYKYTVSELTKELSHIIFETSSNFTSSDFTNATRSFAANDPNTYSPSDPGNSNPGLPESIFGIKFAGASGSSYVVEFDSTRAPMWGNFYAKDGRDGGVNVYAYNNGLANAASENILDFIATPDTVTTPPDDPDDPNDPVVPEPGTLALVGIGLAGLIGRRRRRRI